MWLIIETRDDGAGAYKTWTLYDTFFDGWTAWQALLAAPPSGLVDALFFGDVLPSGRYP